MVLKGFGVVTSFEDEGGAEVVGLEASGSWPVRHEGPGVVAWP